MTLVPLVGKAASVAVILAGLLAPTAPQKPVAVPPAASAPGLPAPGLAAPVVPVPGVSHPLLTQAGPAPQAARVAASPPPHPHKVPRPPRPHPHKIPVVPRPHPHRPVAVVEIQTVPSLPGAAFLLDGRRLVADNQGIVRTSVTTGNALHSLSVATSTAEQSGRQMEFVRWGIPGDSDENFKPAVTKLAIRHNVRIQAAYKVSYLVSYRLVDQSGAAVARSRAGQVALRGETGYVAVSNAGDKVRLPGIRLLSQNGAVVAKELVYDVQRVMVDGSNVVQVGSQRFRPAQAQQLDIPLQLRTAHFTAHDLLFQRPLGASLDVVYPNGRTRREALSGGQVTLESLARGNYRVQVNGAGISFLRPIALSRNQYVDLPVISYLDLAVVSSAALAALGGLLFVGVRRRRRVRAGREPAL
jgi:hypothetical protein